MSKDGRFIYQNKQFKNRYDAMKELSDQMIAGSIDLENQPLVEYVGGSKPYIITLVEIDN